MGEEYRGRIFKSGNSMALRLPKALGFTEGMEVRITDQGKGHLLVEDLSSEEKIDVDKIWGICRGMGLTVSADRTFDDRPSSRVAYRAA